jgi:hypothetical protein
MLIFFTTIYIVADKVNALALVDVGIAGILGFCPLMVGFQSAHTVFLL